MLSLIFVTAACITTFSYLQSKFELTKAVDRGNLSIAETVSQKIQTVNGREIRVLEVIGNISIFRDPARKQIGVISSVVNASDLCRTIENMTVGNDSHPFVVSRNSGKIGNQVDQFKV